MLSQVIYNNTTSMLSQVLFTYIHELKISSQSSRKDIYLKAKFVVYGSSSNDLRLSTKMQEPASREYVGTQAKNRSNRKKIVVFEFHHRIYFGKTELVVSLSALNSPGESRFPRPEKPEVSGEKPYRVFDKTVCRNASTNPIRSYRVVRPVSIEKFATFASC